MNIQRFAFDGTYVDSEALATAKVNFEQLFAKILAGIQEFADIAMQVMTDEAFTTQITDAVSQILQSIDNTVGTKLGNAFTSLTTFLGEAIEAYQGLNMDISKSFQGWIDTAHDALGSISEGINSNVEKGSYTTSSYVQDSYNSIQSISESTKSIIKDTASLIGNTGKFIKSATGFNIKEIAQGTIQTVMNFIGSGRGILGQG